MYLSHASISHTHVPLTHTSLTHVPLTRIYVPLSFYEPLTRMHTQTNDHSNHHKHAFSCTHAHMHVNAHVHQNKVAIQQPYLALELDHQPLAFAQLLLNAIQIQKQSESNPKAIQKQSNNRTWRLNLTISPSPLHSCC